MKKVYELRYEADDVYYQLHLAEKKETLENFIESVRHHDAKIKNLEINTREDEHFLEDWVDTHPFDPWKVGLARDWYDVKEHSYAESMTIHKIELLDSNNFNYDKLVHFSDLEQGKTYIDENGFTLYVSELLEFGASEFGDKHVNASEWDDWKWNLLEKAGKE